MVSMVNELNTTITELRKKYPKVNVACVVYTGLDKGSKMGFCGEADDPTRVARAFFEGVHMARKQFGIPKCDEYIFIPKKYRYN